MNNNVLALTGAEALFFLAGAMAFAAGLAVLIAWLWNRLASGEALLYLLLALLVPLVGPVLAVVRLFALRTRPYRPAS